jgi:thioredoxin 1
MESNEKELVEQPGVPVHLDEGNFQAAVAKYGFLVADFWAPWCGPCRMVAPVVEELAREYEGRVKFVKVDTEQNPGVAGAMGIRSIPSLLIFKGRNVVEATLGARSKEDLREMLDRALGIRKPGLLSKLFH